MTFLRPALPALVSLLLTATAFAGRPVAVLVPLSNISGADESPAVIAPLFEQRLQARGWDVAPAAEVEAFLEEHRVRYLESLPADTRSALVGKFGASAIVFGSVLAYHGKSDPMVALSARMTDTSGRMLWGEVVAISGGGVEGALGVGRHSGPGSLAREAAHRLLRYLPQPRGEGRIDLRAPRDPETLPNTYRSARHPHGISRRVCIVPFAAKNPQAVRVMFELLAVRLAAGGEFEVVEPAEFRDAMRKEKIRSIAEMTSEEMARVGKVLGTPLFLRGNVHAFTEMAGGRSEVQLDMTLSDVDNGTILWAVAHRRRGYEYSGLFQRGTVNNVVDLTDRVVSEAVTAYRNAPLRTARNER